MGSTTSFTYTAEGRIAAAENAEGGVTRYTYDACGNLVQTEDALGRVAQYEYDAMNNRIKECLAENGEQSCITLYVYDRKGRMIREISPLLEETAYAYDGNDSLVSVTDGEQRETAVTYDLNRRPVSVAYSDGRTAAFRYNRRGELVEMQDWNGTTAMERDVLGRLAGVTDHNGRRTGFTHDAAGNRTGIRYPDGSAAAYAFDRNNRLLTVTEYADGAAEDAGETAARYAYDAAGSVVSLIQSGSAVCLQCRPAACKGGVPVRGNGTHGGDFHLRCDGTDHRFRQEREQAGICPYHGVRLRCGRTARFLPERGGSGDLCL